MRHEREDTGQRGAGRPKNSLLLTVCGLSRIPAPPGLLFLLVHRGTQRALSYGTESCFFSVINLRPRLTWARRLGEQFPVHTEGKSVPPKGSLLPAHLVCLSTRPQAPRGRRRWLSLSHPFIHSLIHLSIHFCTVWTLVCARPCAGCLCGLLVRASGERSEPGPDRVVQCWACRDRMVFPAPCARQRVGWEQPAVQTCWGKCPSPTSSISLSVKQPPQKGVVRSQGCGCTWQRKSTAARWTWSRGSRVHGGVAPLRKCCSYVCPSVP